MEMTAEEPAPFSQGCGACGVGCWQDLLLHKGSGTEQAKCRQPEGWAGVCSVSDGGMARGMERQRNRWMEGTEDGEEEVWMLPQSPAQSTLWGIMQPAERRDLPGCFGLGRGAPRGVPTVPWTRDFPITFCALVWGEPPAFQL